MSSPGIALSAVKLPGRRISRDGTGDRFALINDSISASCAGVGIAVVASPNN